MVRTQIYLTERQHHELAAIARFAGKKQSILIREAVDRFIDQAGRQRRDLVLRDAAGIWKARKDLPDFETARSAWDHVDHEGGLPDRHDQRPSAGIRKIEFLDLPSPVSRLSPGAGWHTHKAGFHCCQG